MLPSSPCKKKGLTCPSLQAVGTVAGRKPWDVNYLQEMPWLRGPLLHSHTPSRADVCKDGWITRVHKFLTLLPQLQTILNSHPRSRAPCGVGWGRHCDGITTQLLPCPFLLPSPPSSSYCLWGQSLTNFLHVNLRSVCVLSNQTCICNTPEEIL